MKRLILIILILGIPFSSKPKPPPPVRTELMQVSWRTMETRREMATKKSLKGRLLIPCVGIDVGLYYVNWDNGQRIADRKDSAGWYHQFLTRDSEVIADHKTQEFKTLPQVKVGDTAYLVTRDNVLVLTCSLVIDGRNTGDDLVDGDGKKVYGYADYICYTCLQNWRNVRIVGFDTVGTLTERMRKTNEINK